MSKKRTWPWVVMLVVGVVVVFALPTNYIEDVWTGLWYQPGEVELAVRDELELTAKGERIFNAAQPMIEESAGFNSHCLNHSEETTLLGCYVDGRIYVYEITNEQLRAANKVTVAHELLHAVWERMGVQEKLSVTRLLKEVVAENQEWFDEELEYYDEGEKLEEVYTRAATKLENLPEGLEKHYAKYFRNRAKIVKFYQEYEAPFLALQAEIEALEEVIERVAREIETEREQYMQELEQINRQVDEFNRCAEIAGCFSSEHEFTQRRQVILYRQEVLEKSRQALNDKINEHNARIEEQREKLTWLGELNDAMDSRVELVEEI